MRDDPTRYDNADYEDYFELQRALRALGDEVRLNITRVLAGQGEVNVTDLALRLAVSQPLVSWHVGVLRRAGLAHKRRQGREVYISLVTERFDAVRRQLGALVSGETGATVAPSDDVASADVARPLSGR